VFVLDTHVWVWGTEERDRRIGPRTRRILARAESQGLIRLSPASLFEVTALHVAGHLHLARPVAQWLHDALERSAFRMAEVTDVIAIDAGYIPRTALPDPIDRFLVATARQLDATFVTADRAILAYARGGHVRAHDASR